MNHGYSEFRHNTPVAIYIMIEECQQSYSPIAQPIYYYNILICID